MEKLAWIGFWPMKTICGVLGGLIISWSAYVKICSWGGIVGVLVRFCLGRLDQQDGCQFHVLFW